MVEAIAKPSAKTRKPSGRGKVDWEAVRKDYCAGIKTDRQIGSEQMVSHTAIQRRAKKEGWTRDLAERIRKKADTEVAKKAVAKEIALATEKEVVEANAAIQVQVRLSHRTDIQRYRVICNKLAEELELGTDGAEFLEQLAELITADDRSTQRYQAMMKAISLPSRVGSMEKLATTLKTLITLEREAFGIDSREGGNDDKPVEERVRTYSQNPPEIPDVPHLRLVNGKE